MHISLHSLSRSRSLSVIDEEWLPDHGNLYSRAKTSSLRNARVGSETGGELEGVGGGGGRGREKVGEGGVGGGGMAMAGGGELG